MTLKGLNLTACMAALATMGVVACGDASSPNTPMIPPAADVPANPAVTDPALTPSPDASLLPAAPPEIPADGVDVPPGTVDSTDPTAPPPNNGERSNPPRMMSCV